MNDSWENEIRAGDRFQFGRNWKMFLRGLDEAQISRAVQSLQEKLQVETLADRSFLDVGCGSGLFSLAARRLGACVRSFDFDPQCVACAEELRSRFFPDDPDWHIERGSILDTSFLVSLGGFEIVYSWGVLHHTGEMWQAIRNAAGCVAPGGKLFIAIYNDGGPKCRRWKTVKRIYNHASEPLRALIILGSVIRLWGPTILKEGMKGIPFAWMRSYGRVRGMSAWTDLLDWVGGYPYEYALPENVSVFCRDLGFDLRMSKTCGTGIGCNEFVFSSR